MAREPNTDIRTLEICIDALHATNVTLAGYHFCWKRGNMGVTVRMDYHERGSFTPAMKSLHNNPLHASSGGALINEFVKNEHPENLHAAWQLREDSEKEYGLTLELTGSEKLLIDFLKRSFGPWAKSLNENNKNRPFYGRPVVAKVSLDGARINSAWQFLDNPALIARLENTILYKPKQAAEEKIPQELPPIDASAQAWDWDLYVRNKKALECRLPPIGGDFTIVGQRQIEARNMELRQSAGQEADALGISDEEYYATRPKTYRTVLNRVTGEAERTGFSR